MTTNLRNPAVAAVAAFATAAAVTLSLSPTAGATGDGSPPGSPTPNVSFGAIAVAPDGAVGKAWQYRTRAHADYAAVKACGVTGCEVLSSFTRCGAVADDGSSFQGGTGRTRAIAEDVALIKIGGGGWIITWACN